METQEQHQQEDNHLPHFTVTNGDGDSVCKLSAEEVKGALGITASTGKFWLDWEELKSVLYFQLKQVLSEYPEAKMGDDQQNSALGESYLQLVKRLEEALFSFIEGPPFTLQRLSEILLNARTIYPNLSKLALALEKNLLVTSTLTKSTDPYVPSIVQPVEQAHDTKPQPLYQPKSEHQEPEPEIQQPKPETQQSQSEHQQAEHEHLQPEPENPPPEPEHQQEPEPEHSNPHPQPVENGEELATGDNDEVMTEAEADDNATFVDMEAYHKILNSPERLPVPSSDP